MFVQSEKFERPTAARRRYFHHGRNPTTPPEDGEDDWRSRHWGQTRAEHTDSFHTTCNPRSQGRLRPRQSAFNDSDWRGRLLKDDRRWQYGVPQSPNANFAWVQHFIYTWHPPAWRLRPGERLDVL
jgi:type I restriction enzyme M protein